MEVNCFQPKINLYFWNPTRSKRISNTIVTLFLGLQLIYGFNFGFIEALNKKFRPLCQCISYFMTFVVTSFIVLPFWIGFDDNITFLFNIIAIVAYVGHNFFLHINKYKLYYFIKDIRIVAEDLHSKEQLIGWVAYLCMFITCVFKFLTALYACLVAKHSCAKSNTTIFILYVASSMGLDVMFVVQIIIYYYIYNGVKQLKRLIDEKQEDLDDVRKQFVLIADRSDEISILYGNLVSR